ncbi:glycerophosphodiester phosphodiesterase [bacterium]|nr:MAG: glycerophosphodiester phosphodiesterase [bacterium]
MANFIKIAHRGSSGSYPENTRLAFEKAIEAGVDMIEIDCQLSKDGHVVVFHDERLQRTTGAKGYVKGKTLRQLKKLDAGAWFKKSFKGEKILTLEEVMEIVVGKADLNLEIKHVPRGPVGLEIKILFILSHYDYLERAIFSSFDYRSLGRVRELAPEPRIGLLYGAGMKDNPFQAAREVRAYSLHIQKELATPAFLERAVQFGLRTFVWTVNEVREMEKFLSLGVDGLISDFPEKFWKIKQRKK